MTHSRSSTLSVQYLSSLSESGIGFFSVLLGRRDVAAVTAALADETQLAGVSSTDVECLGLVAVEAGTDAPATTCQSLPSLEFRSPPVTDN